MINYLNYLGASFFFIVARIFLKVNRLFARQYNLLLNTLNSVNADYLNLYHDVCDILIAIEDKRFYSHHGVDVYSMLRAAKNTITKRLEGASTIHQQLVRIITNQRTISLKRKFYEILLASLIHKRYSRLHILTAYVQLYPFSCGIGVSNIMTEHNFKHPLSSRDKACIVARFKYPYLSEITAVMFERRVSIIERKILVLENESTITKATFYRRFPNKLNHLPYDT